MDATADPEVVHCLLRTAIANVLIAIVSIDGAGGGPEKALVGVLFFSLQDSRVVPIRPTYRERCDNRTALPHACCAVLRKWLDMGTT